MRRDQALRTKAYRALIRYRSLEELREMTTGLGLFAYARQHKGEMCAVKTTNGKEYFVMVTGP